MSFFNYQMPPFLSIMGALYILVGVHVLIGLLKDGYWNGIFKLITYNISTHLRLIVGVLCVVLGLIVWVDLPFTVALQQLDSSLHARNLFNCINMLGDAGVVAGILLAVMMLADQFECNKLSLISKISLMSSLYGGLANAVLKFIFNRQRPAIGLDPHHFFAFFTSGHMQINDLTYAFNSMPSGHTISVVAAVVPFMMAYRNTALRVFLLFFPVSVALARIYTQNHWLSDVVAASLVGFLVGVSSYQLNIHRIASNLKKIK